MNVSLDVEQQENGCCDSTQNNEEQKQKNQIITAEIATTSDSATPTSESVLEIMSDSVNPTTLNDTENANHLKLETDNEDNNEKDVTISTNNNIASLPTWNHANRKVLIQGVLKFNDVKAMKKMLDPWLKDMTPPLEYEKIKKPPRETWMVLTMKDESMVQPLIDYINNNDHVRTKKGNRLFAKKTTQPSDNDMTMNESTYERSDYSNDNKKRKNDIMDNDATGNSNNRKEPSSAATYKRLRQGGDSNQYSTTAAADASAAAAEARRPVTDEEIKDKIIPYWRLSEQQQRDTKMKDMIKKCAMKITNELKSKFRMLNKDKNRTDRKVDLYPWIAQKGGIYIHPIVSAPTPLRNKSEFTFGYRYLFDKQEQQQHEDKVNNNNNEEKSNLEKEQHPANAIMTEELATTTETEKAMPGNEESSNNRVPACGFMVTGWAGGVCRPHGCPNIPTEHCAIVDLFDEFLLKSKLSVYDAKSHKGFWRLLTIRTSRRTLECMIVIQHTPANVGGEGDVDANKDGNGLYAKDFEAEKSMLIDFLTKAEFSIPNLEPRHQDQDTNIQKMKITSIFFQEFGGLSTPSPEHAVQHAYGKTCLTERLGKCNFEISPGAFFQVNTEGAEILYQVAVDKVKEVSKPDDSANATLLFDVCCGTGTIGLTCLKEGVVEKVVGVDISEPAIKNAQKNAGLNGFGDDDLDATESWKKKTRFIAARAEQVLAREISTAKANSSKEEKTMTFVAVVDPAREGLHADVIKTVRANEQIKRLVYVSCNPTGSMVNDACLLCSPPTKRYTGTPFKITSAQPVDMFPLTNHCEMVMTFDRLDDEDTKNCSKMNS